MRSILIIGVCTALGASESWDQNESVNQTHWREVNGSIRTIYRDVRSDFGGVATGYPIPDWTLLTGLSWEQWTVERDPNQMTLMTAPATTDDKIYERRHEGTAMLRGSLGYGFALEISEVVSRFDDQVEEDASYSIGDVRTNVLIPLWSTRYSGGTLALGANHPTGDRDDWIRAHGGWTFGGSVRTSAGFGMWTVQAEAGGDYCPVGYNKVYITSGDEQSIQTQFMAWQGGVAVSYRPLGWVRLGVSQRGAYYTWEGREDSKALFKGQDIVVRAPTLGVLEVNPVTNMSISGGYGVDWASSGGTADRQVWHASFSYRF